MLKIAAVVASLALSSPAIASADVSPINTATWNGVEWVYPGEVPNTNESVRAAVVAAVDHWTARDVQPCGPIRVYVAPALDGAGGRAQRSACKLWLLKSYVNAVAGPYGWARPSSLELLGMTVTHEVGHLGGLPDAAPGTGADPIMDGTADETWGVRVYVRDEVKRIRAAADRARASRRSSERKARRLRSRTPRSWAADA